MKIAFVDLADIHYQLEEVDTAPLGGSQSAMILVAEELVRAGDTVWIIGMHLKHGAEHRGIRSLDIRQVRQSEFEQVDAVVSVNYLMQPATLDRMFPRRRPRMIHWHKNDALANYAMEKFAERASYEHVDRFVFGSHSQAASFIGAYAIPYATMTVIPNPLAPNYCGLFAPDEPILAAKEPDLLIYASAPNRGLEGLLKIVYPDLLKVRPNLKLDVYSGFYLDQGVGFQYKGNDLTKHYQDLIKRANALPGVTCHPGVPKSVLAQKMRRAGMLCYPTIFRETSCHVALEAMAAGCLVSTTTIGALPETTAGFGYLTPGTQEKFDPSEFTRNTLKALEERDRDPAAAERKARRQVEHVNRTHAPAVVGRLWREFLLAETARGAVR